MSGFSAFANDEESEYYDQNYRRRPAANPYQQPSSAAYSAPTPEQALIIPPTMLKEPEALPPLPQPTGVMYDTPPEQALLQPIANYPTEQIAPSSPPASLEDVINRYDDTEITPYEDVAAPSYAEPPAAPVYSEVLIPDNSNQPPPAANLPPDTQPPAPVTTIYESPRLTITKEKLRMETLQPELVDSVTPEQLQALFPSAGPDTQAGTIPLIQLPPVPTPADLKKEEEDKALDITPADVQPVLNASSPPLAPVVPAPPPSPPVNAAQVTQAAPALVPPPVTAPAALPAPPPPPPPLKLLAPPPSPVTETSLPVARAPVPSEPVAAPPPTPTAALPVAPPPTPVPVVAAPAAAPVIVPIAPPPSPVPAVAKAPVLVPIPVPDKPTNELPIISLPVTTPSIAPEAIASAPQAVPAPVAAPVVAEKKSDKKGKGKKAKAEPKPLVEPPPTTMANQPIATPSDVPVSLPPAVAPAPDVAVTATEGESGEPKPQLSAESEAMIKKIPSDIGGKKPTERPKPIAVDRAKEPKGVLAKSNEEDGVKRDAYGINIEVKKPALDINYELQRAYDASMAGQTANAMEVYKMILANDTDNKYALFGLATLYHRSGQIDQARSYYSRLLTVDPQNRDGLNNFLVLLADEAPEAAIAQLESLEQRNPQFSPIPAQLAVIYQKIGDPTRSIDKMTRAIELSPENLAYRYNLAILLDRNKNYEEAAKLYRQVVEAYYRGEKMPGNIEKVQQRLTFISSNRPR